MSDRGQWLEFGLEELPVPLAQRVRLFRGLLASSTMLRGRLDRELSEDGLTTRQAALLQFVEARPGPPGLGEVAAGLGMTHQNARQIVDALVRKGFLEVEVDADDRRVRRLVATERHRRYWARRNADDFARIRDWTAGLSDREVETLVELLARLRRHLAAGD